MTEDPTTRAPQATGRGRFLRRRTVIALVVLLVLVVIHPIFLRMLAWPLQSAAASSPADYFCLRGGESGGEGYRSLDLAAQWQAATGGTILLLTPYTRRVVEVGAVRSFQQVCREELAKRKVPSTRIEVIDCQSHDAWEDVRALSRWLEQHPAATVRLSCGAFAGGRTRYVLDRLLGAADSRRVGLDFADDPKRPPQGWWRTRAGVKDFMYAWLELLWARWHGAETAVAQPAAADFQRQVRNAIGEAPR